MEEGAGKRSSECVHVLQNENNSVKFQALVYDISSPATAIVVCEPVWPSGKPALNWANVCSLNILRTVRRTMIRLLIELLVRRTWFGQFEEFTCSQLACNEMQASARPCGRRAADIMIENVG